MVWEAVGWKFWIRRRGKAMYSGFDPQGTLRMVLQRQEETRAGVMREGEARRVSRASRERSPVAFKLWRLHVMVWFGDAREA